MTYEFNEDQLAWLEALESGEHEQGYNGLKRRIMDGDGNGRTCFCCLGLACHVLDPDGFSDFGRPAAILEDGSESELYAYHGGEGFLDASMTDRLKLNGPSGDALDEHSESLVGSDLIQLNDHGTHSFADIARELRENPERYFRDAR